MLLLYELLSFERVDATRLFAGNAGVKLDQFSVAFVVSLAHSLVSRPGDANKLGKCLGQAHTQCVL